MVIFTSKFIFATFGHLKYFIYILTWPYHCRAAVTDSNRGVQIFEYLQNICNLREILKIEGRNIGLFQKSRGAIAPLAPL